MFIYFYHKVTCLSTQLQLTAARVTVSVAEHVLAPFVILANFGSSLNGICSEDEMEGFSNSYNSNTRQHCSMHSTMTTVLLNTSTMTSAASNIFLSKLKSAFTKPWYRYFQSCIMHLKHGPCIATVHVESPRRLRINDDDDITLTELYFMATKKPKSYDSRPNVTDYGAEPCY